MYSTGIDTGFKRVSKFETTCVHVVLSKLPESGRKSPDSLQQYSHSRYIIVHVQQHRWEFYVVYLIFESFSLFCDLVITASVYSIKVVKSKNNVGFQPATATYAHVHVYM